MIHTWYMYVDMYVCMVSLLAQASRLRVAKSAGVLQSRPPLQTVRQGLRWWLWAK